MPVPAVDAVLGVPYLAYDKFRERAELFGCGMVLANYANDDAGNTKLVAVLAAASRDIDSVCGRSFIPDNISENHTWNPSTRRTKVGSPPVMELVSYKIRMAPTVLATFGVSGVYINNQEGYIELASLSAAAGLTPMVASLGLIEPQVEIVYKSYQTVPIEVMQACGFQAAHRVNEGFVNAMLPAGFGSLDIGGIEAKNVTKGVMPDHVRDLLGDYIRIPIA